MEGLRTGAARTEVFRVRPSTFDEDVGIAINVEFNFKAARYGTHGHAQSSLDRAEPMDVSHADDDEAELQAVEQKRACGSTRNLCPNCSLRRPRQSRPSRNTSPNRKDMEMCVKS